MIKDSNFKALENELSVANVVFKNEGGLSTLHFNNFSNPNDFKVKLEDENPKIKMYKMKAQKPSKLVDSQLPQVVYLEIC